ncbi:MAG: hypothetical protein ACKPJJ_33455, partial [Planctomycetaceae bacterium]
MRFSQNARIVLQENGVVFSKPLSSLLSSDSTMVFNSEAPAGKAEISADVAEKILDEYAREIQNEIKVEANQTKILVRVLNQEIIPAKLLVMQSVAGEPEGKVKAAAVLKVSAAYARSSNSGSCPVILCSDVRSLQYEFGGARPR